jgi:CDP-paratose 2-epimerase
MRSALITGSAGLVGSATAAALSARGLRVLGVDNDQRSRFFGPAASTLRTRQRLERELPGYVHFDLDIVNQAQLSALFAEHGPSIDLIVHAAAQPSHDWAASEPVVDFQINALGTLLLLELTRRYCPSAVFIYVSTNKVYGDVVNELPLVERATRWELDASSEYAAFGVDESMRVDRTQHSLFGCSKLAADVLVQEYARYFGLSTGCFRCGCITGGGHAAVEQHGFLAYLMSCAVDRRPYVIHGYGGKQVRDNIHAEDLVSAFEAFAQNPRPGAVYNMGGGRERSISVLEAIDACERVSGHSISVSSEPEPRRGDHVWWISDVRKFQGDYPGFRYRFDNEQIFSSVHSGVLARRGL